MYMVRICHAHTEPVVDNSDTSLKNTYFWRFEQKLLDRSSFFMYQAQRLLKDAYYLSSYETTAQEHLSFHLPSHGSSI